MKENIILKLFGKIFKNSKKKEIEEKEKNKKLSDLTTSDIIDVEADMKVLETIIKSEGYGIKSKGE